MWGRMEEENARLGGPGGRGLLPVLVEALAVAADTVGNVDGRVGGHVTLVDRVRPLVGVNVSCHWMHSQPSNR